MPLQFGRWQPDALGLDTPVLTEAINCIPNASGFRPLRSPQTVSEALPSECKGAATVLQLDGTPRSYAGTQTDLYRIQGDATWLNLSGPSAPYSVGEGERWRFAAFGDLMLATSFADPIQKASIAAGTAFADLGGSPPKARYIDILRDFVVIGCIDGNENRVQWSGLNDAEEWTPGTNFSDFQDFPQGGPITGILGGEVAYIFQRDRITRMTYVPGSDFVFQFDEVESSRGLSYPNSLVRYGNEAYFWSDDGLYKMSVVTGLAQPVGVGKFHEFLQDDVKKGAELFVYGAFSPSNDAILWSYPQLGAPSLTVPNRVIWYAPHVDEASTALLSITAVSEWLTAGYTLDTIPVSFGSLDELPVSLDSAFWKGGAPLLGFFQDDNTLRFFEGPNMEAAFQTVDAQPGRRTLVRGIRPHIDTTEVEVDVSARERKGDPIEWGARESMEDTGVCPAWKSGNYVRARMFVAEGADWTQHQGMDTDAVDAGDR